MNNSALILVSSGLLFSAWLPSDEQQAPPPVQQQAPAAAQPAPTEPQPNDGKIRVYVTDSQSWEVTGGWGASNGAGGVPHLEEQDRRLRKSSKPSTNVVRSTQ